MSSDALGQERAAAPIGEAHMPSLTAISLELGSREITREDVLAVAAKVLGRAPTAPRDYRLEGSYAEDTSEWDSAFAEVAADPLRGVARRWVLADGESIAELEERAARAALDAAGLSVADVDLLIATRLSGEPWPGPATRLAARLGTQAAAFNIETACSSTRAALDVACAMVRAGQAETVLVSQSCAYSTLADPLTNPLGWTIGDGAGAFVVQSGGNGAVVLGSATRNTAETIGSYENGLTIDADGQPRIYMYAPGTDDQSVRRFAASTLRETTAAALAQAGCTVSDIAIALLPSPLAWYVRFAADVLGVPIERTFDLSPYYANLGSVLTVSNLWHAVAGGRVRPGDLVLVFAVGTVSSAGATVLRWGDVAIAAPTGPRPGLEAVAGTPLTSA